MITKNCTVPYTAAVWAFPKSEYQINQEDYDGMPFTYKVRTDRPWEQGAVKIHSFDSHAMVPANIDVTAMAIATLEAAVVETNKDAALKVAELVTQIQSLLLLEAPKEVTPVYNEEGDISFVSPESAAAIEAEVWGEAEDIPAEYVNPDKDQE